MKDLQQRFDKLSTGNDITITRSNKRSIHSFPCNESNIQETLKNVSATNPIEMILTSTSEIEKINNAAVVKEKIVGKSSDERNISSQSHQQENSNRNTVTVEKLSRFQNSPVALPRMKRSTSGSKIMKDNESYKSTTLHHEENKASSILTNKIPTVKLAKNMASTSSKISINTIPKPVDGRIKNQNDTNNVNNNTSNGIPNEILPTRKLQNIAVKAENTRINEVDERSNLNSKGNDKKYRAISFNVDINEIASVKNNDKFLINHPKYTIIPYNTIRTGVSNGVTVIPVKK